MWPLPAHFLHLLKSLVIANYHIEIEEGSQGNSNESLARQQIPGELWVEIAQRLMEIRFWGVPICLAVRHRYVMIEGVVGLLWCDRLFTGVSTRQNSGCLKINKYKLRTNRNVCFYCSNLGCYLSNRPMSLFIDPVLAEVTNKAYCTQPTYSWSSKRLEKDDHARVIMIWQTRIFSINRCNKSQEQHLCNIFTVCLSDSVGNYFVQMQAGHDR